MSPLGGDLSLAAMPLRHVAAEPEAEPQAEPETEPQAEPQEAEPQEAEPKPATAVAPAPWPATKRLPL